jgi:cell division protein FtsQ
VTEKLTTRPTSSSRAGTPTPLRPAPTDRFTAQGAARRFPRQRRDRARRQTPGRKGSRILGRLVVAVIGLICLGALGAWVVLASPLLTVTAVRVHGASAVVAAAVRADAAVPIGRPLARLDTTAIAQRALAKDLASVTVRRSWPHTVDISVVPREPVLAVGDPTNPQGQVDLWDRYGVAFATAPAAPAGVPLLETSQTSLTPVAVTSVAGVLQSIPASQRSDITRVTVSPAGLVTFRLKRLDVVWGDATESPLKLHVLNELVPQAHSRIDVSAPRSPAVR